MAPGKKILIVDDHQEMRELLQEIFQLKGYQSVLASNGQEALAQVYHEKPDLILLDVMLPLVDGYAICRTLKNAPETKGIPVILVTAKGDEADIERGFESRADGYVVKPFEPNELMEFAESFLHPAP
jgi:DNA-binding response OmpR family regulator